MLWASPSLGLTKFMSQWILFCCYFETQFKCSSIEPSCFLPVHIPEFLWKPLSFLGLFLNLPGKFRKRRLLTLRESEKFFMWAVNLEQGKAILLWWGLGCKVEAKIHKNQVCGSKTIHATRHFYFPKWMIFKKYFCFFILWVKQP